MNDLAQNLIEELQCETVFTIPILGGIPVSEAVVVTWIIMAVLVVVSFILTRNLKVDHISKRQAVAEARKTADEEYQRIVTDAHKTASQIKDDAEAEAISQKEQILKKAEKEIADMVVDAAAKVVGSNSADTNAALYDTFLNKAGDK